MNDAVLPYLRCPNCWLPLAHAGPALRCPRGHSFDLARQGYAALLTGSRPHAGDSAAMVADRTAFLAAGHYAFLADALASAASAALASAASAALASAASAALASAASGARPLVVDAGTGTGYYLARVLDALPGAHGVGVDVATAAVRRAARAHPRATAVLADLWRRLPLADGCAGLVLDVFAPRNGAEFRRILRPDGTLLVVTPAPDHLAELVEAFGLLRVDADKAERLGASLEGFFATTSARTLRHPMRLSPAEVRTLIGMTPSARHISPEALHPPPLTVTASVTLTAYRPL